MKRTRFVSLVAGAGAAVSARVASAQTAAPVRMSTIASESTGALFYAQEQGFFAKRGIDAQITIAANGSAVASAMLGGDLEIGYADPVILSIGHDKGLPFAFLAPGELHSIAHPTLAIAVRDPAVKSGKDFNGVTFACTVVRTYGTLLANSWIDNNGGDSNSIKWVEIPFPAEPAALQRGAIDAFIAPEPFISQAAANGGHVVLLNNHPIAPIIIQGGFFATRDWVNRNRVQAKAFIDAIYEASAWANRNLALTAPILSKYSKVPVAIIESSTLRGQYPETFDPTMVQPLINGAAKYGYISKPFPVKDMLATI